MNKKIFIDFDGTMVDVWNRYYSIINDFWRESINININEYKKKKWEFPNDIELLQQFGIFDKIKLEQYQKFKREQLENIIYLKKDVLLCNKQFMKIILNDDNFYILTRRRNTDNLRCQMRYLGIEKVFSKTIVLSPNDGVCKKDWFIQKNISDAYMIGDSEMDMDTGTIPGIKTFFVQTGIRSGEEFKKNLIYRTCMNINEAIQIICDEEYR